MQLGRFPGGASHPRAVRSHLRRRVPCGDVQPEGRGAPSIGRRNLLLGVVGRLRYCDGSIMRWAEDWCLFVLGTLSFAAATFGRLARQRRWHHWVRLHITGMGSSYILLLTAFYVDNGKHLPLVRDLPSIAYWVLPSAAGIPLIVDALLNHPLARTRREPARSAN